MSTVTTIAKSRVAEHAVADIFIDRWSPRAFTDESISDATLYTFFEAARWAPSSYNSQPWRFLYAKRGSAWFNVFLGLLSERNQTWAKNAAVLLLIISKTSFTPPGKTEASPARNHSFDAGAAWSNFAHQATLSGWHAHGIGGFDVERARVELGVPAEYHIDAAIAVGRHGDKSILPEQFHAGEMPNGRKPVADIVHEGGFSSRDNRLARHCARNNIAVAIWTKRTDAFRSARTAIEIMLFCGGDANTLDILLLL